MVGEQVKGQVEAVYVDPVRGDDRASGKLTEPLKTLTAALQQVATMIHPTMIHPTMIHLSPGDYTIESGEVFPLTIAGVAVVGDPASRGRNIIISGSGEFHSPTFAHQSVTMLMEGDAQLRGVTITNPAIKGTGIWIESPELPSEPDFEQTEPTIASCTLRQCGREGIFVTGTAKPAIANCLFQGNLAGLAFVRSAKGEVRRCIAVDNGFGMVVSDRAAPLIVDSQFAENRVGLRLSGTSSPVLRRNAIEYNIREGLVAFGATQPDLGSPEDAAENRLKDNGSYDLQNQTAIALVSGGNWLNPTQVTGAVEFPALRKLARPGGRSHPSSTKAHPNWAEPFIQAIAPIIPLTTEQGFQPTAKLSRAAYGEMLSCANFGSQVELQVLLDKALRSEAVTRLEAIAILTQLLDLPAGDPGVLSVYRDRAQIPSQNVTAIAAATQSRLVVSSQTDRLNPLMPITQAETIALIYQAGVIQGKFEAIVSPQIVNPASHTFADLQRHTDSSSAPVVVVLQANLPPPDLQSSLRSSLQASLSLSLPVAEIVLAIAQETISLLQFQGIEAFLGRSDDDATLSISLQMAIPDPDAIDAEPDMNGIAISHPDNSLESARLAQLIHKTILRHIDTRTHGVQPEKNSLPILIPTSCITVGFVTGQEDAINLSDAEYRRCMARAIAKGILSYIRLSALMS